MLALLAALNAGAAPVISEFMAANLSTLADEDGDFSDWIEIQNPGATAINLGGWILTDDAAALNKWTFPSTNLTAGGRIIVFASGKNRRTPGRRLHTNFSLSSNGEYLALIQSDGTIASAFWPAYPKQRADVSYGLVGNTGTNGFLFTATPNAANTAVVAEFVADTKFSGDRGLCDTNFLLAITCATEGSSIYYTTNGTSPSTSTGILYTGAIPISRTTVIRARAEKNGWKPSNVDTQSYLFLGDVITQSTNGASPPGWPATWGDNAVDYGMDPDIVTRPPWSGTISNDLRAIPTLSLVMRLPDLFDAQTGIYANAGGEGRDWERQCSLELIYPDGREGFAVRAGIRVRGGFSRSDSNPKHSLRFIMREEYGDSKLKFPFFGPSGASEFDKFDLRTSQDGSWAFLGDPNGLFLNDPFARDTLLALGQPGERGDWYHLYINGQYWGMYNSCERPEASYAAAYFGGAEEDWDVLKPDPQLGYIMKVTDGNDLAWVRLWRAATNGFAANADYFRVQGKNPDGSPNASYENLLDVENLIDYLLVIFWTGDFDGPIYGGFDDGFLNNYYAFRDRTGAHGGFRFVTHDAELSLGDVNENRISTSTIGDPARGDHADRNNPYYLWTRLLPNAEFKTLVADRVQKHFFDGGALTCEAATARFAARTNELFHAITGESARWGDAQRPTSPITPSNWRNAIEDKMDGYFPFRANNVLDQLRDAGVFPTIAAPSLSRDGGEVLVGATVSLSHGNATGEIFYTLDGSDPRGIGGGVNASALNFADPILIASSVTVRARVRDGGAWSPLIEANYFPAVDFSGLRITELNYNPLRVGTISGEEFEFLELKNAGTNQIDLGGVTFTGITFTFTNGTRLDPGAFFVLARSSLNYRARYPGAPLNALFTGKLENAGEKIAMKTAAGVEILSVTYNDRAPWPTAADGFGFSLVPKDPNNSRKLDDGTLWRASANLGGSPGQDDPAPAIPTILINELLTDTDLPAVDLIELYNPTAADVNLGGWYLSDDAAAPRKYRIEDGTMIAAGGYLIISETNFNVGPNAFSLSSAGEEIYLFSGSPGGTNLTGYGHGVKFGAAASGISFGRYVNSGGDELFPAQITNTFGAQNAGPRVGPVVINEIHYHPATNYDEYVEILNITDSAVPFFDEQRPTNVWRLNGLAFTFPTNFTLAPRQRALIVGITPDAFRAKYSVAADVPIFGPFAGKIQDSGERLELQRPDAPFTNNVVPYVTVDAVRYNDRAPWPVAADGDGPALQRLAAAEFGDEPTNWFANGLTPGRLNHFNQLPTVALIAPTNSAEFTLPATIDLEATASDSDGTIAKVEFFDGSTKIGEVTGAPFRMTWFTPNAGARLITAKARDNELGSSVSAPVAITVHPPVIGSGFGLRAEYFDGIGFAGQPIKRVDPNIDFTWSGAPAPAISADRFTVRWTSRLQPLTSGTFTFYTLSADGVRLWIDGAALIDNWTDHAETENSATFTLEAGRLYDLRLEYYNANGLARVQLAWSAPGLARQAVPREQLYPPVNPANQSPQINLISPAHNSGFPPGSIQITVNASDADGAIQKVRFISDGALIGESISPPFNFNWNVSARGPHVLTATALDDNLMPATSAPVTVHVVSGYTTNDVLIAAGSTWNYWDRGSFPGANWALPSFDDSTWSNGPAQLGYGDNDEATTLSFGPNSSDKFVTSYFRRAINIPTPETITAMRLRIIRDDGIAVYLNGAELLRDNLPVGPISYGTYALTTLGAPEENTFAVFNIPRPAMISGPNLIAAEIHQGAPDSSDISFDLELTAIRSILAPFIRLQPSNVTADAGSIVVLNVDAGGAPPLNFQWRLNGTNLPGANTSALALRTFRPIDVGGYVVVIQNSLGATTSVVATASITSSNQPQLVATFDGIATRVEFIRLPGFAYRIESTETLTSPSWTIITNLPALSSNEQFSFSAPLADGAARFYRIVIP